VQVVAGDGALSATPGGKLAFTAGRHVGGSGGDVSASGGEGVASDGGHVRVTGGATAQATGGSLRVVSGAGVPGSGLVAVGTADEGTAYNSGAVRVSTGRE
jgi:hypothetical protein